MSICFQRSGWLICREKVCRASLIQQLFEISLASKERKKLQNKRQHWREANPLSELVGPNVFLISGSLSHIIHKQVTLAFVFTHEKVHTLHRMLQSHVARAKTENLEFNITTLIRKEKEHTLLICGSQYTHKHAPVHTHRNHYFIWLLSLWVERIVDNELCVCVCVHHEDEGPGGDVFLLEAERTDTQQPGRQTRNLI